MFAVTGFLLSVLLRIYSRHCFPIILSAVKLNPEHQRDILLDAGEAKLLPDLILQIILDDFFSGWSRQARVRFYRQAIGNRFDECLEAEKV